jgi:hypothetical protein
MAKPDHITPHSDSPPQRKLRRIVALLAAAEARDWLNRKITEDVHSADEASTRASEEDAHDD